MFWTTIQNHKAHAETQLSTAFLFHPAPYWLYPATPWRFNYKSLGLDYLFIMKQEGKSSQAVSDFQSVGCLLKWGSNSNSVGFFAGI